MHQQIADYLRDAVATGQLGPGDRLPSARDLAARLGVARGTIDTAYAALAGEGIVVGRGAGGTVISPDIGLALPVARKQDAFIWETGPVAEALVMEDMLTLHICLPAFDAFPRKLWARLTGRRARTLTTASPVYADVRGLPALRQAIAAYLATSRGVSCRPEQVVVTGGFQATLNLIAAALIRPGDPVWCEDPGYPLARQALERAGATIVPVPVDREGMDVEDGRARCPQARFAMVTPSHQSPLGVALSLPRRLALLDWAQRESSWIIEDDYDSEFHYSGRPLQALKSLDRHGRVLYCGTFTKVLYPALRLGYLVIPDTLVDRVAGARQLLTLALPVLEQSVVADSIAEGHFARHLKRMRSLYAARRRAMAAALAAEFGDRIDIALQAGGMHLMARFPGAGSDRTLARRASRHGLWPAALSETAIATDCGQTLLIGFTNTPEAEAAQVAARLRAALDGSH